MNRQEFLLKHQIDVRDIKHLDINEIIPDGAILCFDTESSFIHENEGIPMKLEKEVFEKEIQSDGAVKKVKRLKEYLNPDFNTDVHVYAWGLSNNLNDYQVIGQNLNQFIEFIEHLGKQKVPLTFGNSKKAFTESKRKLTFDCWVHNLAWDIEFLKYALHDNGFNYFHNEIESKFGVTKKKNSQKIKESKKFNIVENNNIVYSAKVNFGCQETVTYKHKKELHKEELFVTINFYDSAKVTAQKLDTIGKEIIKVAPEFIKIGGYDYESVRPIGHELTYDEKDYLYNDTYILKEWVNQFYLKLETQAKTASGIAFEKFLEATFKEESKSKNLKAFEMKYPDLTKYSAVYNLIDNSYKGGWTQANKLYLHKKIKCYGVSIDINSSYPSVVDKKPLPYGKPLHYTKNEIQYAIGKTDKDVRLLHISFDGFAPKDKKDKIGHIQCGGANGEIFNCSGTEYLPTNIIDGKPCGTWFLRDSQKRPIPNKSGHRIEMVIWDFELESILKQVIFYKYEEYYSTLMEDTYLGEELLEGYNLESLLIFPCDVGFFHDAVEKYGQLKKDSKKEGNVAMTTFAKLVLNSFYGKLASDPNRVERNLVFDENGMANFINTEVAYQDDKKYYKAFASAVTAWGRVNLRDTMYKVGFENVVYFDTDSLYTLIDEKEIRKRCGDILDSSELGKWDIEKSFDCIKAIGAKKYMVHGRDFIDPDLIYTKNGIHYYTKKGKEVPVPPMHDICKCAGLPEDVRNTITFDDFELGHTFKGKKVKTKVCGGYVLIEGDFKLNKQALY